MLKVSKNAEILFTNLTIKEILEMSQDEIKMLAQKKTFTKEKAIKLFKDIKTENEEEKNEEVEEVEEEAKPKEILNNFAQCRNTFQVCVYNLSNLLN